MEYTAHNLEQIAAMFEAMAQKAESACNAQIITKIAAYGFKREAASYRNAASVLRATKLTNPPS